MNIPIPRTLSTFLIFALCPGQRQVSSLGYAPLPNNLVKGGRLRVANIPGHVSVPAECPAARGSQRPRPLELT